MVVRFVPMLSEFKPAPGIQQSGQRSLERCGLEMAGNRSGIRAALAAETSTRLGVKNNIWRNRETPERTDGFGVSGSEQVTLKRINSRKSERSKAPSFTVVSGGVFNFKALPMFLCAGAAFVLIVEDALCSSSEAGQDALVKFYRNAICRTFELIQIGKLRPLRPKGERAGTRNFRVSRSQVPQS
jgi:hypothetical protein